MAVKTLSSSIAFLGCGKLGSSILDGILLSVSEEASSTRSPRSSPSSDGAKGRAVLVPKSIVACVHRKESAALLRDKYGKTPIVKILANENVRGVRESDIIILGVEPNVYRAVLAEPGMVEALSGKILVTIVGGLSIKVLEETMYGDGNPTGEEKQGQCRIVRALPNTATAVREGMTLIIEEEEYPYATESLNPVYSLFMSVGQVKLWPASKTPIGATLSASSPALFTLILEAAVNAGVSLGLDRGEALELATAGMRGAAGLIAGGEHTGEVKRKITTKGGSTEAGLKVLEESNAKGVMEKAIKSCAFAAGRLGGQGTRS